MRKFILLAGTALTLTGAQAAACDLELMGGPQRFNAFAAYGAGHASVPVSGESADSQQEERAEPEPEQAADRADAPAEAGLPDTSGSPEPSATFR